MSDDREIIEVEDYRVLDVREQPIPDDELPPAYQPPPQQWSGRIYTTSSSRGGGGCCLGATATILLVTFIFVLGLCALILLIGKVIGWAIPGL